MHVEDRLAAFEKLGKYIGAIDEVTRKELTEKAQRENSWFTPQSIECALTGVSHLLQGRKLTEWIRGYRIDRERLRAIAVVMAGNIPLVGFHDFLCVMMSGNKILIKPSSKDKVLLNFLIQKLTEIEPRFADRITTADLLKNFDAVIATGSDNSSRYFEYYFKKYHHIIRKNRTSCAVLTGFESSEELEALGKDVFTYFGLGCRNVSKLFVPEGYSFENLIESWDGYKGVMMHHKYHNNYDYQKSILLVNGMPFLDSGFFMLEETQRLVSPISVLYYEHYKDWAALLQRIGEEQEKIQCIVGNVDIADVKIGHAQTPGPSDYSDKIDTLEFLLAIP
jgi:hypothetical protein